MISQREWFEAGINGDMQKLHQNIRQFAKKQDPDTDGDHNRTWTAMIYAARAGQTESVAFLSRFEARLTNASKETALMWAVRNGKTEQGVPFLTQEKTMQNSNGETALHIACRYNYVECAKYLLSEISLLSNDGKTPLQIAKENGENKIIYVIENFEKDKMFRVCDKSDWFIAVRAGYTDSVKKYYQQYKSGFAMVVMVCRGNVNSFMCYSVTPLNTRMFQKIYTINFFEALIQWGAVN